MQLAKEVAAACGRAEWYYNPQPVRSGVARGAGDQVDGSHYELRFWGVRGTVSTPAADKLGYGGNTICLATQLADGEYLVLDGGTGLRHLGAAIASESAGKPVRIHVLFSHYHFDHIEGLPLFLPLYDRNSTIVVHGFAPKEMSVRETLEGLIRPPWFPARLSGSPARIEYSEIDGSPFRIGDVTIETLPLNHPDGSLAFRLDHAGRKIVFATDHEHGRPEVDAALAEFSTGVDYLIYDATYIPAEYESLRRGWGHSTWYAAVAVARAARLKNLILFHHHPEHSDAELESILALARTEFPNTFLAREGDAIPF